MTSIAELVVAAEPSCWRAVGFDVDTDGLLLLDDVRIRLVGGDGGLTSWTLAGAPDPSIDLIGDLSTQHVVDAAVAADAAAAGDGFDAEAPHPNGVDSIDHIVVHTPDLERTCAAIEAATGAPLRRIREVGALRQGFHRLGSVIVEVVTFPQIEVDRAVFWGLALNVGDIDALYTRCGDASMSAPKDAVQPGRRIASFRESAGLGLPVAVMTPHVRV